ncbi:putative ribonuclease H-like domain-containing protein [Tanacetum coccineum]
MLVQVYVDDIIFGSTRKSWCDEFEALMKGIFQMSSMGELIFFLGLQVKQKTDGIFISQDKYVADMLKKFDLASVKTTITPMETKMALTKDEEVDDVDVTPKTSHLNAVKRIFKYLKGKPNLGLWYPRESSFDLEAFSNSDYAGANLDRKSTTGGCQFLGRRLISWQCKKQTIMATSTTEAEYVAAANCHDENQGEPQEGPVESQPPPNASVQNLEQGGKDLYLKLSKGKDSVSNISPRVCTAAETLVQKMVELVEKKRREIREQKLKAKKNKPMTQAEQRNYMMNYVRSQSHGWTIPQLKKLSFEELKEKESLKRSGETLQSAEKKKQKVLDVEDIPISESAKFVKEEEIEVKQPVLKMSRIKSKARKGIGLHTSTEPESGEVDITSSKIGNGQDS